MRGRLELTGKPLHDLRKDLRERNRIGRPPYPTNCLGGTLILAGEFLTIPSPLDPGRVSLDVVLSELLSEFKG